MAVNTRVEMLKHFELNRLVEDGDEVPACFKEFTQGSLAPRAVDKLQANTHDNGARHHIMTGNNPVLVGQSFWRRFTATLKPASVNKFSK